MADTKTLPAILILADGTIFNGTAPQRFVSSRTWLANQKEVVN